MECVIKVAFNPSFYILGAAKCGTTSLHYYLSQHPDVCISQPKEPHYFEIEYENGSEFYRNKYFGHYKGECAVGDARAANLYVPYVPERIKDISPNAKLIVLLRNPIMRAYSHWYQFYTMGIEPLSFDEGIAADIERIESGINFEGKEGKKLWQHYVSSFDTGKLVYRTYVDRGYYLKQIERYLKYYDLSQIKIILFDDLKRIPKKIVADIFKFIGVDFSYSNIDFTVKNAALPKFFGKIVRIMKTIRCANILSNNLKQNIKSSGTLRRLVRKTEMSTAAREFLKEHYSIPNNELSLRLGISLSQWD
jgi:hypothetical protein